MNHILVYCTLIISLESLWQTTTQHYVTVLSISI